MPPTLADFACRAERSRGRVVAEEADPLRCVYQRDRDRILHSTAFRRLKHKTQVFVSHEGDHYRTRLTHTLEVAQIARTIARALSLNEDLCEAVSLVHDFGHPPFGHAGERALDRCMRNHGGFDHNLQTLRIVTRLERRYGAFDGLNLTYETLEGILKHNGPIAAPAGAPGRGHCAALRAFARVHRIDGAGQAHLEAQAAALADDIAYNAHDIDDGLRAGLFDIAELRALSLASRALEEVDRSHPGLEEPRLIHEMVRRIVSGMVGDVVAHSRRAIEDAGLRSPDDARGQPGPVIRFSAAMNSAIEEVRAFLQTRMYDHPQIVETMQDAARIVEELFTLFAEDSRRLPLEWRKTGDMRSRRAVCRHISDFIAGMTDVYALDMHRKLAGPPR